MITLHPEAAKRISTIPELSNFVVQLNQILVSSDPDTFWQCENFFHALLESRFLEKLVLYELSNLASYSAYIPFGGLTDYDLAIVQAKEYTLAVRVLEPDTRLINRLSSSAEHSMVGVANFPTGSAGKFAYRSYTQPDQFATHVLDRTKKLVSNGVQTVEPGHIARFFAARDVYIMLPMQKPVILLILASATVASLYWEYDRETLRPIRAISASHNASRLQYTAYMLSEIGNQNSVAPLQDLMEHEDHFVRWAAVRAIMKIDFYDGLKMLDIVRHDPHPHVRNAASKALAKYA
ncbi:MAG: HEAT repeat domain-containing protein [Moorea sp. SIO2I5]|nr:HEAT repeat domain-containing protein [Moorena sp. SIO2I5]